MQALNEARRAKSPLVVLMNCRVRCNAAFPVRGVGRHRRDRRELEAVLPRHSLRPRSFCRDRRAKELVKPCVDLRPHVADVRW